MNEEMKAKLPKWALYEVVKMERELEALREQVESYNNPNSAITYGYPKVCGLPDNSILCFTINNIRFDVSIRNGSLKINSGDAIAVFPEASNVVSIKTAKC